jgi:hypothetical protein
MSLLAAKLGVQAKATIRANVNVRIFISSLKSAGPDSREWAGIAFLKSKRAKPDLVSQLDAAKLLQVWSFRVLCDGHKGHEGTETAAGVIALRLRRA